MRKNCGRRLKIKRTVTAEYIHICIGTFGVRKKMGAPELPIFYRTQEIGSSQIFLLKRHTSDSAVRQEIMQTGVLAVPNALLPSCIVCILAVENKQQGCTGGSMPTFKSFASGERYRNSTDPNKKA